jgi:hypothetical protein
MGERPILDWPAAHENDVARLALENGLGPEYNPNLFQKLGATGLRKLTIHATECPLLRARRIFNPSRILSELLLLAGRIENPPKKWTQCNSAWLYTRHRASVDGNQPQAQLRDTVP